MLVCRSRDCCLLEIPTDIRVCPTCPYKWVIAQRISMRTHLKRKEVDDVLGGKDSWANVDSVDGESASEAEWSEAWSRNLTLGHGQEGDIRADSSHLPRM